MHSSALPKPPLPTARLASRPRSVVAIALAALLSAACSDSLVEPAPTNEPIPMDAKRKTSSTAILPGASLYLDPYSSARKQADLWRADRPADAAQMDRIAGTPQAFWLGEWSGDVRATVDGIVSAAARAGTVPVLVAYNIPQRDCGGLSGGGGATAEAYKSWIAAVAEGIGRRSAAVVVEPDALAAMDCLSSTDQQLRVDLIRHAVRTLKAKPRTAVYIDAGHARWKSAETMGDRLRRADIAAADGFSLNISNFLTDEVSVEYGQRVSAQVGGKHFVVDSSRNGLGPTADYQWCNPDGRALGRPSTTSTGQPLVDAYLWIKRPGESDGACNGGPSAGQWWAEYALGLAQRASW